MKVTTRLRRWLNDEGEGAVMWLAAQVGVSHAQISRLADGHRGASLPTALAISAITGIPPQDLVAKVTSPKGKKPARTRSARGRA